MRHASRTILLVVTAALISCSTTLAAFDVTMWDLQTSVQFFGSPFQQNFELLSDVSNPWNYTSLSTLNSGLDRSQAAYDYSWLRAYGTGEFRTSITHAIRSSNVETVSRGLVYILPTEDIRVTIDAILNYSHTPGDETGVRFGVSIRDENTHQFLFQQIPLGGHVNFQPSSGTLTVAGEQILAANVPYRLSYTVDSDNLADASHPPTGIFDATGYVHFSIEPLVPEPATLTLLISAAVSMAVRRRERLNN